MGLGRLSEAQERFLLAWAAGKNDDGTPPTLGEIRARAEELLRDGGADRALKWSWAARFVQRHPNMETRHKTVPSSRLDQQQEMALAEWARAQAAIRSPPTLEEIQEQAREILAETGDSKPLCASWAWHFAKRHPGVETSAGLSGGSRLSRLQEAALAAWTREQSSLGAPPSSGEIREQARKILAEAGDTRPLNSSWGHYFAKRHPELETRKKAAARPKWYERQESALAEWDDE